MYRSLSILAICPIFHGMAQIVMETDEPDLPEIVVVKEVINGTLVFKAGGKIVEPIVDPDKWTAFPTPQPVVTGSPTIYPTPLSPAPTINPYYLWHLNSHDQCIFDTGLVKDDCLEAALLVGKAFNFPYYLNVIDDATVPCGCSLFFNENGDPIVNYNRNTPTVGGCATNVQARLVCLLPPPTMAPSMHPTLNPTPLPTPNPTPLPTTQGGGSLRLVGGSGVHEGRVEMYYNGVWGTICDDGFDMSDGSVICNQLGFGGVTNTYHNAHFGQGSGQIVLDDLACNGAETRLLSCPHSGINVHNCVHAEDASVTCNLNSGSLRLVSGSDSHEGRVEIYYNGNWGTICDDNFDINDANVVCNQLGYNGAEQAYQAAHFGQGSGQIVLDDLGCNGAETRLLNCPHSGINVHNCQHGEDASVTCRRA